MGIRGRVEDTSMCVVTVFAWYFWPFCRNWKEVTYLTCLKGFSLTFKCYILRQYILINIYPRICVVCVCVCGHVCAFGLLICITTHIQYSGSPGRENPLPQWGRERGTENPSISHRAMGCYRSFFSAVSLPRQSLCAKLISIPAFFKLAVTPHKKEKCKLTKRKTFKMRHILSDRLHLSSARYDLQVFLQDFELIFFPLCVPLMCTHSAQLRHYFSYVGGKKLLYPHCEVYCTSRNVHSKVQASSCGLLWFLEHNSFEVTSSNVSIMCREGTIVKTSCSEDSVKWEARIGVE